MQTNNNQEQQNNRVKSKWWRYTLMSYFVVGLAAQAPMAFAAHSDSRDRGDQYGRPDHNNRDNRDHQNNNSGSRDNHSGGDQSGDRHNSSDRNRPQPTPAPAPRAPAPDRNDWGKNRPGPGQNHGDNGFRQGKDHRDRFDSRRKRYNENYGRWGRKDARDNFKKERRKMDYSHPRRDVHEANRWNQRKEYWRANRNRPQFRYPRNPVYISVPAPVVGYWKMQDVKNTADYLEDLSIQVYYMMKTEVEDRATYSSWLQQSKDNAALSQMYDVVDATREYSAALDRSPSYMSTLDELFNLDEAVDSVKPYVSNDYDYSDDLQDNYQYLSDIVDQLKWTYHNELYPGDFGSEPSGPTWKKMMVKASGLNMRAWPNTSASVCGQLNWGDMVYVTEVLQPYSGRNATPLTWAKLSPVGDAQNKNYACSPSAEVYVSLEYLQ